MVAMNRPDTVEKQMRELSVSMRKTHTSAIECAAMAGGALRTMQYYGYTRAECEKIFRAHVEAALMREYWANQRGARE